MRYFRLIGSLSLLSALPVAHLAGAPFTDTVFNLANYTETSVFKTTGTDTVTWDQCASCGNPGQALQILMTLGPAAGGGFDVGAVGFINSTFIYNPATQGPILSIDASVDKNINSNLPVVFPPAYSNTFRPLIEQDGIFYLAAIPGALYPGGNTGYVTLAKSGLMAADFVQFDFTTATFGAGHPNFAGDPILLGLGQISTFSQVVFEADYDNLSLAVNAIPEPSTFALLGSGVLAAALFLRKRILTQ